LNGLLDMAAQHGGWGLSFVSFIEAIFFPIPPDTILIPLALSKPTASLFYAFIATVFSVAGGLAGYAIGYFFRKTAFLQQFAAKPKVRKVGMMFDRHGAVAMAIAGFTPIPFKVFTISAGFFRVPLVPFILGSVVGRAGRFFLIGVLILFFGEAAKHLILQYGNWFTLLLTALLLLAGWLWVVKRRRKRKW